MSTYSSSGKSKRMGLRLTLGLLIALFGAVALVLGLTMNKKVEYSVAPETNVVFEELNAQSLLSNTGWNDEIAAILSETLADVGDNVALGNAKAVLSNKIISLGGYDWSVVYKQKGIVTLYAHESVATLLFDKNTAKYADSAIRNYLNNEFYNEFLGKVGFSGFKNLIVPYGASDIYYQLEGAQGVVIETLDGKSILNNDGVAGDKIWLPSAYEVGGFAVTEKSPAPRVNSFKPIESNDITLNSGLWNLSNAARLAVNNAVLRSTADGKVNYLSNGVIKNGEAMVSYEIRPCFNMVLPEVVNGEVIAAENSGYVDVNTLYATVEPDFSAQLHKYTTQTTGNVFTAKTGNATYEGMTVTNSQALLLELSDAVNAGQSMSGKTFELCEDVDMSNITVWNPIGRTNFPFSGIFNGKGYKISNLCSAGSGFVGLFGNVSGANAKVYQTAVVDSGWYTTNANVGAIAGIIGNSATIEQCYSASGISGSTYVGGIVGKSTSTSTIKNCYNLYGVAGTEYVGGIIGLNESASVINCYNAGAVTGIAENHGGIFGGNSGSASYTACVYNSENNTSSNSSQANVSSGTYAQLQGKKTATLSGNVTQVNITKPTAMNTSSWTFNGSPWTISTTLNDQKPILQVFVKNIRVDVRSIEDRTKIASQVVNKVKYYVSGATSPAYAASNVYEGAANSSKTITIYAQSKFSGNEHYAFTSWNTFGVTEGNVMVPSSNVFVDSANTSFESGTNENVNSITLPLDDSYNLEAVFERLYGLSVSPVFDGFADEGYYAASELTIDKGASTVYNNIWYREGDQVTITIGTPLNRLWKFEGLKGSTDGSNFTAITPQTGAGSFVQASNTSTGPFVVTIGHSDGYVSKDMYYIRPYFARYYNVTLENNIPALTGVNYTITTSVTISNPSATINSDNANTTAQIRYDAKMSTSVSAASGYSNYFEFDGWDLKNGNTIISEYAGTNNSNTIAIAEQSNAGTINLTMLANFKLATKTVTIRELAEGTVNSAAGKTALSTSSNLEAVNSDTLTASVPYGTTIYLYVLPMFSAGYSFGSFSLSSAEATMQFVGTTGLIKFNFNVVETATYDVNYVLAGQFGINFTASLDGAVVNDGTFTFTPASYANKKMTDTIGATVACEAGKYFLEKVYVTYETGATDRAGYVYTADRPSSGGYVGSASYTVLGSTETVATLLNKISATALYNCYSITVEAQFIAIVRSINVVEKWEGVSPTGSGIELTHAKAYSLVDVDRSNLAIEGQGVYQNSHKITATPGAGYMVKSIVLNPGNITFTAETDTGTHYTNHSMSKTFKLSTAVGTTLNITITYAARTYELIVSDNLATLDGEMPAANLSTYNILVGDSATTVSGKTKVTAHVNVNSSARITGFQDLVTIKTDGATQNPQVLARAQLDSILLIATTGATTTQTEIAVADLGTEWSKNFTPSDTFDKLELRLVYITLRAITIKLVDSVAGETQANAAMVILKDTAATDPQPNIVVIVQKGVTNMATTFCVDTRTYKVAAVMPVYVSSTNQSTANVTIAENASLDITIELEQDPSRSSVFSSAIFS